MSKARKNADGLTDKQAAFCRAFVEAGGNASQAYRETYNASRMKPETIKKRASELLTNRAISGTIAELQAKAQAIAAEQHEINLEWLIERHRRIIEADVRDFYTWEQDGRQRLKTPDELTPAQRQLIEGIGLQRGSVREDKEGREIKRASWEASVRLPSRTDSLKELARLLGLGQTKARVDVHHTHGAEPAAQLADATDPLEASRAFDLAIGSLHRPGNA